MQAASPLKPNEDGKLSSQEAQMPFYFIGMGSAGRYKISDDWS